MAHLQGTLASMAENDPMIVKYRRIPTGNIVLYHGRVGSMRQGRTSFPAIVLQQHPDDGSLDLIVDFEAEDRIWEQRVLPWSEAQPGHCWTLVEPIERRDEDNLHGKINYLLLDIKKLQQQMYGDFNPPEKSMIEYLDDFDKRLTALEKSMRE